MSWHPFDELLSNRCELRLDSCLRWRHWSVRSMGFHSFFVTSILCGDRQITAKITAHTKTNKNAKTWHRTLLIWWCSIYSLTDSNACPCLSRAKSKRDLQRKNANKMYYLMEISMEHHVLIRTFFHVFRCELTTFWWKISAMENWFGWARRWNSLIKYPLICVAVQIDCVESSDVIRMNHSPTAHLSLGTHSHVHHAWWCYVDPATLWHDVPIRISHEQSSHNTAINNFRRLIATISAFWW